MSNARNLARLIVGADGSVPGTANLKINLPLTALHLLAHSGFSMAEVVNGWADTFEDESGVDTGSSTGVYVTAENAYGNWAYDSDFLSPSATVTSNIGTSTGSLSNLVDGSSGTYWQGNVAMSAGSPSGYWIKFDLGSGVTKRPAKIRILNVANSTRFQNWQLQGSNDDTFTTKETLYTGTSTAVGNTQVWEEHVFEPSETAYRYFRIVGLTGLVDDNQTNDPLYSEFEMMELTTTSDITLLSTAHTAESAPSTGRVTLVVDPQDTLTHGTDNRVRMSRDGGTTWVTGAIEVEATDISFPGGNTVDILTATFDFTGTPTGTEMKVEWSTLNNKAQLLRAWYPEWS